MNFLLVLVWAALAGSVWFGDYEPSRFFMGAAYALLALHALVNALERLEERRGR